MTPAFEGWYPNPDGSFNLSWGYMNRNYEERWIKAVEVRPTPDGRRGAVYMPAPQTGSPMTYLLEGRQYLVVAVSGAGHSGELLAFRLPQ